MPLLYRRGPVVAVSETTREALIRTGFAPASVRVVHNGITPAKEGPEAAGHHGRGLRIACVGRVKRYKRLDRLVRAVAALREEFPDIRLDVAGSGDTCARRTLGILRAAGHPTASRREDAWTGRAA